MQISITFVQRNSYIFTYNLFFFWFWGVRYISLFDCFKALEVERFLCRFLTSQSVHTHIFIHLFKLYHFTFIVYLTHNLYINLFVVQTLFSLGYIHFQTNYFFMLNYSILSFILCHVPSFCLCIYGWVLFANEFKVLLKRFTVFF